MLISLIFVIVILVWQSKTLFLSIEKNIRLNEILFAIAAYPVYKLHAFFRLIILDLTLSMIIESRHEQICLRSFLLDLTQSELSSTEDDQKL